MVILGEAALTEIDLMYAKFADAFAAKILPPFPAAADDRSMLPLSFLKIFLHFLLRAVSLRENMEVRKKVEAGIRSANKNFVIAKAGMSEAALNTALMAPKQEVNLEAGEKNVMSVDIPTFQYKTRTADENDKIGRAHV